MTEYDYSPAAYERYLAQQARVSNWVSDTLQQSHAYSNPFALSPTLRDRSFYDQPDDLHPHHHRSNQFDQWSNSSSRPSRERSRSYVDHAYHDRGAPPRYRSQSHSRSSSRDVQVIYSPHESQPYYPDTHVVPRTPAPRMHTSPPHNYGQYPSRQAYVTQPPPGQIYHLSPNGAPAPAPKESLYRHPSQSRSSKPPPQPYLLVQGGGPKAEYKRGPPIHAPVPMKPNGQQPLYKRLLGFVTQSPVGGRSGNGRGPRGSYH